jgi:hypothetical protein
MLVPNAAATTGKIVARAYSTMRTHWLDGRFHPVPVMSQSMLLVVFASSSAVLHARSDGQAVQCFDAHTSCAWLRQCVLSVLVDCVRHLALTVCFTETLGMQATNSIYWGWETRHMDMALERLRAIYLSHTSY